MDQLTDMMRQCQESYQINVQLNDVKESVEIY